MLKGLLTAALGVGLGVLAFTQFTPEAESGGKGGTFVYVHDAGGPNQVLAYRWEKDGTLTPLAGSPFATGLDSSGCGGLCQTLAYSKKRKALVATGGDGLHVLLVAKDGTLTNGAGSPLLPGDVQTSFNGVEAVSRGKQTFVFASEYGADAVRGYSLAADGMLTELAGSPTAAGDGPDGMAATNKLLFAMNENAGSISSYAIGKDGALTEAPGSPLAFETDFSWNLHIGPKGKRVFTGEDGDGDVFGFSFSKKTAELTALPASPVETALQESGSGLSIAKKGPAVIVPQSGGVFQAVKIEKDGDLTPLGEPQTLAAGGADAHGRSANGKFLVLANTNGVTTYSVDKKTGVLTLIDTEAINANVNDLHVVKR